MAHVPESVEDLVPQEGAHAGASVIGMYGQDVEQSDPLDDVLLGHLQARKSEFDACACDYTRHLPGDLCDQSGPEPVGRGWCRQVQVQLPRGPLFDDPLQQGHDLVEVGAHQRANVRRCLWYG
ncbi:hypothetical protein [Streptomyces durhamensis]|uniref:hypothetical protein n=1 Tax=Streptomyces durhamensis TaxID=68194 RepID=UPI001FD826D4|nr:hypothetical protein [Streptomyces durhamensis]